jgi:hypothetical protein
MSRVVGLLIQLPLAGLAALAALPAHAQQTAGAAAACTSIEDPTQRLNCYDRASGRPAAARGAAPGSPPAATLPAAAAPAASAAAAATAPQAKPQSFGLYAAEHPTPPPSASSVTGTVTALGRSASGRPTVTLEDGQLWELDDADPLLAAGDVVSIHRAALGSFEMTTPSKRTHRTHRLR